MPKFERLLMNVQNTIESYKKVLMPFYKKELKRNSNIIVEGDNAMPHQSTAAKDWIQQHHINHEKFGGHPTKVIGGRAANSPDLCPIEYVFNDWTVATMRRKPKNVSDLIKFGNQEWKKVSQKSIQAHYIHQLKVMKWVKNNSFKQYQRQ